jgi:hypothetical protein
VFICIIESVILTGYFSSFWDRRNIDRKVLKILGDHDKTGHNLIAYEDFPEISKHCSNMNESFEC